MGRRIAFVMVTALVAGLVAAPAWACGGLIAPNGTISLVRTATLAAYHDGIEHYVTSFEFAGKGAKFGSIVPLPGIPSDVKRGGDWTLQRLQQEVQPQERRLVLNAFSAVSRDQAEVILETEIDALDITVLKGGGDEVGLWAERNGFALPPDAPEVLDFYAERSPIFMAARFDLQRARELGRANGDGIPIHVVIPTPDPWVPLRILALGRQPDELVQADVFLLTDARPSMLPAPSSRGMILDRSEPASELLLQELRSDKGMRWLPADDMVLTYLRIDTPAKKLTHDLAVDETGLGSPSFVAAGLQRPEDPWVPPVNIPWALWVGAGLFGAALLFFLTKAPARWA
ncbi:MAG: DUF2330 domain-containing protein [Actinomycetota bacterium]